jgi:hypothetical protein
MTTAQEQIIEKFGNDAKDPAVMTEGKFFTRTLTKDSSVLFSSFYPSNAFDNA